MLDSALSAGPFTDDTLLRSFGAPCQALPCDLDGDGRGDLLVAYASGPARELKLAGFLSDGSGFHPVGGGFATGKAWSPSHLAFFAIDVDGDGRADLVEAYARVDPARGELLTFRTYLSRFGAGAGAAGESFGEGIVSKTAEPAHPGEILGFWPADLDGDGAMDLLRLHRRGTGGPVIAEAFLAAPARGELLFAAAVGSDLGSCAGANPTSFFLVDVDGDGIADLVQVWTEPSASGPRFHRTTFFGNAAGQFSKHRRGADRSPFRGAAHGPFSRRASISRAAASSRWFLTASR